MRAPANSWRCSTHPGRTSRPRPIRRSPPSRRACSWACPTNCCWGGCAPSAIARVKVNRGGSSLSFRVDFADGSRAAFKPAQTNLQTIPRKEVAAYRLNRLLGMNAVPPALPRDVSREELLDRLHPESAASLPRIQAETIFNPAGQDRRRVLLLDPRDPGQRPGHARGPADEQPVADAGHVHPAREAAAGRPAVRPGAVRLPHRQPRPLLGGQHQDVAGRDRACTSWTTPWRSS